MGDVGNFLLGGSKSKQGSQQASTSTSSSQNASQQGSISDASNQSASNSASGNQAYAPIAGAMSPTLGYTASGGNMLGALLGLPGYTPTSGPAPAVAPTAMPLPSPSPAPAPSAGGSNIPGMISMLHDMFNTTPAPSAPTPMASVPAPATNQTGIRLAGGGGLGLGSHMKAREFGGPVKANEPYVVGEKRPEVFVPQTDGHIVPQVPAGMMQTMLPGATASAPSPGGALDTWSNSAGMNFLRDQGTKAISNVGSANGTFQSGATGKALEKFGMGLGSTYQNDYINHLLDFAKLGLGGASAMSGAGGVSNANSTSSGNSGSVSMGNSSGSSTGLSSSTGTSTGSTNSKKGLIPDILG